MASVRLFHRLTGSVVVVPEEKATGLAILGYEAEGPSAKSATAKKAPAKKAASSKTEK